jgi:very-short-patch-repair endonuclease
VEAKPPWGLIDVGAVVARFGPGPRAIGAIAAGQDGMATVAQLRYAGLTRRQIQDQAVRGLLYRVHRGVYAVGHRSATESASATAAVLGVGEGSIASHDHAAALQELLPFPDGPVDVTVPPPPRRSRPGIRVHESSTLARRDVLVRKGLPLTAPARTILDLADRRGPFDVALNEARALRAVTDSELRSVIARNSGRPGAATLSAFLAAEQDRGFSRSEAEEVLRPLIRRAGLPPPQRNVRLHGAELDFYWPAAKLNVETDGFAVHSRRRNFESDRARDARLASFGIQVLRFTWWQLTREAPEVVARIAAALAIRAIRR